MPIAGLEGTRRLIEREAVFGIEAQMIECTLSAMQRTVRVFETSIKGSEESLLNSSALTA